MTTTPHPSAVKLPRRRWLKERKGLATLLAVLLVVTLVAGLAAIGGYFYLNNRRAAQWTWQDPLAAVDSSRVRPDLGVIALLDQPSPLLVQQSLLANEADTAYALMVYSLTGSDAERSGSAQLVGKAFEQIPALDLAALSYQQMLDIAALSPTLADPMRAQISLDAAKGFVRAGQVAAAQPALVQAEVLARYSPLLAPVQRQDVARQLQAVYRQLGDEKQAETLDQLVREPRGVPTNKFVRGPFLPQFTGSFSTPEALQAAIDARHQKVYDFLTAWDTGDEVQIEAASGALSAALLAEDLQRSKTLGGRLEGALELSEKTGIALDHVRWLVLKYLLASNAVGYSLAPQWEKDRVRVAGELQTAFDQLLADYRDAAGLLSNPDDARAARVEILRQQILWGRLGLYPGYDESALGAALEQAQRDADDILPLLVVQERWGDGGVFRIAETLQ